MFCVSVKPVELESVDRVVPASCVVGLLVDGVCVVIAIETLVVEGADGAVVDNASAWSCTVVWFCLSFEELSAFGSREEKAIEAEVVTGANVEVFIRAVGNDGAADLVLSPWILPISLCPCSGTLESLDVVVVESPFASGKFVVESLTIGFAVEESIWVSGAFVVVSLDVDMGLTDVVGAVCFVVVGGSVVVLRVVVFKVVVSGVVVVNTIVSAVVAFVVVGMGVVLSVVVGTVVAFVVVAAVVVVIFVVVVIAVEITCPAADLDVGKFPSVRIPV